jgi:hypothetical protein
MGSFIRLRMVLRGRRADAYRLLSDELTRIEAVHLRQAVLDRL